MSRSSKKARLNADSGNEAEEIAGVQCDPTFVHYLNSNDNEEDDDEEVNVLSQINQETMDDIVNVFNVSTKPAQKKKLATMSKHFNMFLNQYMPEKRLDTLVFEDFTVDLVGKWAGYLAQHARKYCRPDRELLSLRTIAVYFSAFKTYFAIKFVRETRVAKCFDPKNWKMATDKMLDMKKSQCISLQKPMYGTIAPLSDDDRKALAAVCMWVSNNTLKAAEFLHLVGLMYCVSGRGSKVSQNMLT